VGRPGTNCLFSELVVDVGMRNRHDWTFEQFAIVLFANGPYLHGRRMVFQIFSVKQVLI